MSHLIHVVELKNQMTEKGVTDPVQQYHLLGEAYVRAILRCYYSHYRMWSQGFSDTIWEQLDKWNCVSPIPAQQIMSAVENRINLINSNLMNTGSPNCSSQYSTTFVVGDEKVDMVELPGFATLVAYLCKELGAGDE